jgi:hypothetical protein
MILTYTKTANLDKLTAEINNASIPLNYLSSVGNQLTVVTLITLSSDQVTTLNNLVNAHNPVDQTAILAGKLDAAMVFGKALIVEVALANIQAGITAAGKTRAVSDYAQKLQNYLVTGSLYAAIEEITALRNDLTRPLLGLSPFITDDKLDYYKQKIQTFVSQ